jgi:tetratricopeptide (TPR) repeat protein
MLNFKFLQNARPKEVKVVASGNFLESLSQIDVRVADKGNQERIKVEEPSPPPVKVKEQPSLKAAMPSLKSLKVIASGSFLDSLSQIENIRVTKVNERDQSRDELSRTNFQEAMAIINRLTREKNFNLPELKIAANKLIISIENNKNNAEAYINLALIFYVLKNIPASIRYLKVSKAINPDLPEIKRLQQMIGRR